MVGVSFPVQPLNLFLPREIGYQAGCTYLLLRCTPQIQTRHHTYQCPSIIHTMAVGPPHLSRFMTPDQVTDHVTGQVTFHRPFPCLSVFVDVCLHMFGHLTFLGKLYIVLMLREPTSLSFNIDFNTLILSLSV